MVRKHESMIDNFISCIKKNLQARICMFTGGGGGRGHKLSHTQTVGSTMC